MPGCIPLFLFLHGVSFVLTVLPPLQAFGICQLLEYPRSLSIFSVLSKLDFFALTVVNICAMPIVFVLSSWFLLYALAVVLRLCYGLLGLVMTFRSLLFCGQLLSSTTMCLKRGFTVLLHTYLLQFTVVLFL